MYPGSMQGSIISTNSCENSTGWFVNDRDKLDTQGSLDQKRKRGEREEREREEERVTGKFIPRTVFSKHARNIRTPR